MSSTTVLLAISLSLSVADLLAAAVVLRYLRQAHEANTDLLVQIEEYARQVRHGLRNVAEAMRLTATAERLRGGDE